jgi:hypothetical protein
VLIDNGSVTTAGSAPTVDTSGNAVNDGETVWGPWKVDGGATIAGNLYVGTTSPQAYTVTVDGGPIQELGMDANGHTYTARWYTATDPQNSSVLATFFDTTNVGVGDTRLYFGSTTQNYYDVDFYAAGAFNFGYGVGGAYPATLGVNLAPGPYLEASTNTQPFRLLPNGAPIYVGDLGNAYTGTDLLVNGSGGIVADGGPVESCAANSATCSTVASGAVESASFCNANDSDCVTPSSTDWAFSVPVGPHGYAHASLPATCSNGDLAVDTTNNVEVVCFSNAWTPVATASGSGAANQFAFWSSANQLTGSANATLNSSGNASFGGTLGVTGAATLSSTLAVTGTSTFTGAATANGNLQANGAALQLNGTDHLVGNPNGTSGNHPSVGSVATCLGNGSAPTVTVYGQDSLILLNWNDTSGTSCTSGTNLLTITSKTAFATQRAAIMFPDSAEAGKVIYLGQTYETSPSSTTWNVVNGATFSPGTGAVWMAVELYSLDNTP